MNCFGKTIKKIMIDKNVTQKEIATLLELSPGSVNTALNRENVTLETMEKICGALDCTLKIDVVPNNK